MADAPNNELREILERARSHFDEQLESRLLEAIARSELVVPVRRDRDSGEAGVQLSVNPDGSRHLVAFTTAGELARWAGNSVVEHQLMKGRDVAALAKPARVDALWIDPASEHGGRLSRDRVDLVAAHGSLSLRGGSAHGLELATGEQPLQVRQLDFELPPAAEQKLRAALVASGASDAWLLAGAGPGAADVVLVTVGAPAPPAEVARTLREVLPPGRSADIYPVSAAELASGDYEQVHIGKRLIGEPASGGTADRG